MKETYENMDLLLKAMSYSKYGWNTCADLQVTGLLVTQSFAVFFENGTAEQKRNITKLRIEQCEKTQFQGKSVSEINC